MRKRTVIYRGSLKSCNYSCSYCPFAKHRALPTELERDRRNFERFCDSIAGRVQDLSIGAVFLAPYGEVSMHRWYWEGLSRLAGLPGIDRVGMQTNLSFSVEECLAIFDSPEGKRDKLCIWATFHPEMTTVEEFVSKCHKLSRKHISICAGAVGVPRNIPVLKELRARLSPAVYLWINKMDGLKRNYTPEETDTFARIDPFFTYELRNPEAAAQMCVDRCFVEADGKIHTCNISKIKDVNWYDGREEEILEPLCGRKRCSCYLAYGGRSDFALKPFFGEYPVYRIPRTFGAVFFDLDGTLVPAGKAAGTVCKGEAAGCKEQDIGSEGTVPTGYRCGTGLSVQVREKLAALRKICPIFLATSMPEADVRRRLKDDMELFQGFVFASGAYLCLKEENGDREEVYPVDVSRLADLIEFGESVKAKYKVSMHKGAAYKITLVKGHHSVWKDAEYDRLAEILKGSGCRFFTEQNCLEIVKEGRNKGTGIKEICGWLAIPAKDVLAVGNDEEDDAMEAVCGAYIRIG